jgi:hypothetical protein
LGTRTQITSERTIKSVVSSFSKIPVEVKGWEISEK